MDPNTLPTPDFAVPGPSQPQELRGVNPNTAGQEVPQASDRRSMESPAAAAPMQPPLSTTPPIPMMPFGQPPGTQPVAAPPTMPVDDASPLPAGDSDLIEKEWVLKAKAIVEQTRLDPHIQNKEMNKVRADYLRQRYNKVIKVEDE